MRQGLGERRLFKTVLLEFAKSRPELAKALMPLIPEYSRWDIPVALVDTPLAEEAVELIHRQLAEDGANMEKVPLSVCARNGCRRKRLITPHKASGTSAYQKAVHDKQAVS